MDGATSVTIVELNDSEIRVARDGDIVLRSPGYALVARSGIAVGEEALRSARLNPRAMQNRYWQNLNLDPLATPTGNARHQADLAYAHLLAIHEQAGRPDEVLFAVPGCYSNDQLALLLGLVEAAPFRAVGLIDVAVAAAAPQVETGSFVHVEMYLHQTVLTFIDVDEEIRRTAVERVDGVGLAAILDDSAAMIADQFIRQSRFDPQHHAETEQSLYDRIPACLRTLGSEAEAAIEIPYDRMTYFVKLQREALIAALEPLYQKIIDALPDDRISLVGDRLAALPGFVERLSAFRVVAPDSVFRTCREQFDRIHSSGSALNFVTRLPAAPAPPAAAAKTANDAGDEAGDPGPTEQRSAQATTQEPVTHVLWRHRAWPLADRVLYLHAGSDGVSECEEQAPCSVSSEEQGVLIRPASTGYVLLNGRPIDESVSARVGDVVSFSGEDREYTFIHVSS